MIIFGNAEVGTVHKKLRFFCAILILTGIIMHVPACRFIESQQGEDLPAVDVLAAVRETGTTVPSYAVTTEVPYLCQNPAFPTGCESVSALMVLRFYGYDLTPDDFVDRYLDKAERPLYNRETRSYTGADPNRYFLGDPRKGSGWGCFPDVIKSAVEKFAGDALSCTVLYGEPVYELCSRYIDRGIPVLFWATADMQPPRQGLRFAVQGSELVYTWKSPMHCLVLTGYTDSGYIFNDPLRGKDVIYDKKQVLDAYRTMGGRALVIERNDG